MATVCSLVLRREVDVLMLYLHYLNLFGILYPEAVKVFVCRLMLSPATRRILVHFRLMTTCLENLEISGNLTAFREMSGILLKVRELSGKTSSSAVAKRPRDASCLSVVSFNIPIGLQRSFFIASYCGFRFTSA